MTINLAVHRAELVSHQPSIRTDLAKLGKDPNLAASYLLLSLLSVCYKLLQSIILQRISLPCRPFSTDQAGIHHGHSTCEQVTALTRLIKNRVQEDAKTGAVFLDITTAHDTMSPSGTLAFFINCPRAFQPNAFAKWSFC